MYTEVFSYEEVTKTLKSCFLDKATDILFMNVPLRGMMDFPNWSKGSCYF